MSAVIELLRTTKSYIEERKSKEEILDLRRMVRIFMCEARPEFTADVCANAASELENDIGIFDLGSLGYPSVITLLDHTILRLSS